MHIVPCLITKYTDPRGFPGGPSGKEPTRQCKGCKIGGSIPGLGRLPGGGHGNPFYYSCLENPMDIGAWYIPLDHKELDITEATQHSPMHADT